MAQRVFVLVLLALTACIRPPRPVPPVPAGEWSTRLGITEPLLVEGPVVIATTTSRSVAAFSAENAMHYWDYRFSSPVAGSALRRDDRVFVSTGSREGRAYAFDLTRGRRLWARRVGVTRVEPLLAGNHLILATESDEVVALDAADGTPAWRVRVSGAPAVSPVAHESAVLVATQSDTLLRIEQTTGRVTHQMHLPSTPAAPLLLRGDTLIVATHAGHVVAVSLPQLQELWRSCTPGPVLASPVATERGIYLLDTGGDVWRVPHGGGEPERVIALPGAASASFALAGNRLLIGRLDGTLLAVTLEGQVVWEVNLGHSIIAPAAVHAGAIYVALLNGEVVKLQ
jgi:outer membrane protein assembly factor BamB